MEFDSQISVPKPRHLDWRVIPIPRDSTYKCWLAGPVKGVWTHHANKVSKPCWRRITNGKLECPWCGKIKLRNIGYLPTWSYPEALQRVIIVCQTTMRPLVGLPVGTPLAATQANMRNQPAPCRVNDVESMKSHTWKKLRQQPPNDISEYLVRVLWGIPEIAEHFGVELWNGE